MRDTETHARRLELTVGAEAATTRLDQWLAAAVADLGRNRAKRLILDGRVAVGGARVVEPKRAVRPGDLIAVDLPPPEPAGPLAEAMALSVIYEDDQLIVIDKPAGLVVHPGAGNPGGTLVNALLAHAGDSLSGIGGVARPGIVHRLDKETSGCLVVAKNDETHLALSAQFASRKVEKTYHVIACGEMPRDRGEIRAAIARHPSHRKRMAVDEDLGRQARTSYRVIERLRGATFAEALLHTGRTHQIRVHFQFLGFPVVGDLTYGNRQNFRLTELTTYTAPRQMLHAFQLSFMHPRTGKRLSSEARLPEDFRDALSALRVKSDE
jgi:23S rRNA pseudouridine1911/1915/1917 synthase